MEISKDQIAIIKNCLSANATLVEKLISNLECKTRLDDWQKKILLQHRELLGKCRKSNFVLDNLHPIEVITLENDDAMELLPPSSNSSVNEGLTSNTEQCRVCKNMFVHLAAVDICQSCKSAVEEEEQEEKKSRQILIERTKAIQKEKDRRNTAISQMRKEERKDLKEQITLLETIGYDNLEREQKRSLTVYKTRLAKMETDTASSVSD
jgi:hypothetical protein